MLTRQECLQLDENGTQLVAECGHILGIHAVHGLGPAAYKYEWTEVPIRKATGSEGVGGQAHLWREMRPTVQLYPKCQRNGD